MSQILSIDQGTTNTKVILVDQAGRVTAHGSAPVTLTHPEPGWAEQDADQIWTSVLTAITDCLAAGNLVSPAGIGISVQRESVVAWQRSTGAPIGPVIGWQDRRTADWCVRHTDEASDQLVRSRTGLRVDAMFSAPKIRWLLDHLPPGVPIADVCVGTIDAWLIWRLTGGQVHVCEAGNASRTLLYDVIDLAWSPDLLDLFGIPLNVLPTVRASHDHFGQTRGVPGLADGIPIVAVLPDSHAALFGHGCTDVGSGKATYGTGTSVMTPTATFVPGESRVPSTLAWLTDHPTYAREGNILSSGATLAWVAQTFSLGTVGDLIDLAARVPDSAGVVLVPAFAGLGAPHWNRDAKAVIAGISDTTAAAHIARAALDSVAHQVCDVIEEIEQQGPAIKTLRADGGATASALLMQTQADLLGREVQVAERPEISALGVAQLGWSTLGVAIDRSEDPGRQFLPRLAADKRLQQRHTWRQEVQRALERRVA